MNSENKGIQRVIEIPLEEVQSPDYHKRKHGVNEPCLICGKPLKGEYKQVQLLTNGNIVSSDQDFTNSQGFFGVGKDCAKKLIIQFSF